MAKRNAPDKRRQDLLEELRDEPFYDDSLDTITRNLPTEEEYLPVEDTDEPADEEPSTGFNRLGVRMIGLPVRPDSGEDDDFAPAYGTEEDTDDLLPPRRRSARTTPDPVIPEDDSEDAPVSRTKTRKQQSTLDKAAAKSRKKPRRFSSKALRITVSIVISFILLLMMGLMLLSRTMYPNLELLRLPEHAVSASVGPVQNFFSGIVESVADYFRFLKLRSNMEAEYVKVTDLNQELYYLAAIANENQIRLQQYEDIDAEMTLNQQFNPLRCQVIGREQGNYFSTFTINRGSRHGVKEFMAVTINGGLVGYTETVYDSTSIVRTIIDSNASIAGLIQSSRDQGTVRGTLGVDGTAMCRMYYLPDDHLPRPGDVVVTSGIGMSFPKGIPIGTVRESTRGMDSNKQYIVVEPVVDFEHLEYVIVLRYQPAAGAVESRAVTANYNEYVPTVTARPYPTLRIGSTLKFGETATPAPTAAATPSPTPTATPTPSPTPSLTPSSTEEVLEYNSTLLGPTATPSPSPTPSPTPELVIDPDDFFWEDE